MTSRDDVMKLVVCLNCDRDAARLHAPDAMGRAWFKALKSLLAGRIEVMTTNCMGGCDCSGSNGCCSVGLVGKGRFGYVLNKLEPGVDDGKVEELVRRYGARADGKLSCGDEPELLRHIATRLPPSE